MIERLWSDMVRWSRKLPASMKSIQPRTWIVLFVALLVGVRVGRELFHRHFGHRDQIVTAIGSIGFLYGTPRPDYSGSRIRYLQSSEEGIGVFDSDTATGTRQTLSEKSFTSYLDCVSPFSPHDDLIAYTFDSIEPDGYISICRADSGTETARLEAPSWHVFEMAWLNPERLVCRGWVPGGSAFHLIQKQPDGRWKDWSPDLTVTNASCLTALSEDRFAWVDVNGLCAMNFLSGNLDPLFPTQDRPITEFSYSRQTDEFLVTRKEKRGCSLWSSKLNINAPDNSAQLASDQDIQNAQRVNGGKGYAYLSQNTLVVKAQAEDQPARLAHATIDRFVVAGNGLRLFFTGTVSNEPWAGLWRYDIATQNLNNVVPYSDRPSPYAIGREPVRCEVRTASQRSLNYYVFWPAHFDRHKKYPLFIGDTPFLAPNALYQRSIHGPNWSEAMACCGAYVVIVNRNNWWGGLKNWDSDVMAVYDQLMPDPTIDAKKVYLFGASAETEYLAKLVERRPELWTGLLLLNPTQLADLSALDSGKRLPKMFLSAGGEEGESIRFKEYQQAACGRGISVEIQEIPNSGHFLISRAAVQERTRAMAAFVFNDP
jgi:hypothetical protein